jgi:1-acyl-sn-glycerol-3-phosphate acyltransferase
MDAPNISTPVLRLFRRIVRRYLRRHFHGVRVGGGEGFAQLASGSAPLIIYANHSSWWDPMVAIFLAETWMPGRRHFAPMDAEALDRYAILKHVGIFPVQMNTPRGAVQFLQTGETILAQGGVLWVTPQGRFVDPRVRPLQFKPGLAALAARVAKSSGACTLLPLAIEYPFFDERLPECLLHFGEAQHIAPGDAADEIDGCLTSALEATMDTLQQMALRRDPALFTTMAEGTVGAGGFYAIGQRIKSAILRRPYRPEHTIVPAPREARK